MLFEGIEASLGQTFGCLVGRTGPLAPPDYAYDEDRKQFQSTEILRRIAGLGGLPDTRFLALTECDLFIPMLTFVFGQAQLGGSSALVSVARLRQEFYGQLPNEALLVRRLRKEVIHEVGHTFGLTHCLDRSCPMSLATAVRHIDDKSDILCSRCINTLGV